MKKIWLLFLVSFLASCETKSQDLKVLFEFPETNNEISGIVYEPDNELIYTLEDKGNLNDIYVFDLKGNLKKTIKVKQVENNDWEDLSNDSLGNLYIGDFGNNANKRKDLAIYKLDKKSLTEDEITPSQITYFNYPEQKDFPPKKKNLMFDCEAFIIIDSSFYLFTKNRSKGFDGTFYVYKIPNKSGTFNAEKIAELKSDRSFRDGAITGAAYNRESNTIALITHTKAILISFKDDSSFNQKNLRFIDYNHNSQKESITFKNKSTLLIADEKEKKKYLGGKVYIMNISN